MRKRVDELLHRSKDRIRQRGEVFTPDSYVDRMLDSLGSKTIWKDVNINFFEFSCGHGNFVSAIFKRRLESIYKNCFTNNSKTAALYSIANSINTLWAIDIDNDNVEHCRSRVFEDSIIFLASKTRQNDLINLIKEEKEFFSHLLCAIDWHIHENEFLSSMSDEVTAKCEASKTKLGKKWFDLKKHQPLELDLSWCEYFDLCEEENLVPITYGAATKFINELLKGNIADNNFQFAATLNFDLSDKNYISELRLGA